MNRWLLSGLLAWASLLLNAQGTWQAGLLPSVNLNVDAGKGWKVNFKAESRQRLARGAFGEPAVTGYDYVLTDLSVIPSKKVGLNNTLGAGYLVRARDGEFSHRFLQQFTLVRKYEAFRLGHRFSADQTFGRGESPVFRFRYRLVADLPLEGASTDPGEFYLKLGSECLMALQSGKADLELRIVPLVGYEFTDNNKLEWGLDYRLGPLLSGPARSSFWLSLNWFLST